MLVSDLQGEGAFAKEEGMKKVVLALCVLMLTVLAANVAQATYRVGDHIADFTLNDAYGNPVSLNDYQGQVIWLVFWSNT